FTLIGPLWFRTRSQIPGVCCCSTPRSWEEGEAGPRRPGLGDTEQLSEQQELLIPAKYRVIPCGINFVAVDPQLLYLFCGGLNPGLVPLGIQHRFHSQTGVGSCRANQVDHRFQVPERLPFPGQTDKREDPMLDPVPHYSYQEDS